MRCISWTISWEIQNSPENELVQIAPRYNYGKFKGTFTWLKFFQGQGRWDSPCNNLYTIAILFSRLPQSIKCIKCLTDNKIFLCCCLNISKTQSTSFIVQNIEKTFKYYNSKANSIEKLYSKAKANLLNSTKPGTALREVCVRIASIPENIHNLFVKVLFILPCYLIVHTS